MDRIIEVKVCGTHLSKDNKNAGVRGEANITKLRITFDEGWDEYTKEIIFWDAYGENPVRILITESVMERKGVYLIPIPAEALARAGMLTFTIRGTLENKIQASITGRLEVKDSPDILEPIPPTPTELQQMQNQMERITLPWRRGEGENSVVLDSSGKARSKFSAALGENSVSGVRAFFIESVDFENKKIYLTKKETVPTEEGTADADFETPGYEKGDIFSVVSSGVFPFCGIIESAENNVITWSSIDPYFERRKLGNVISLFSVPERPEFGVAVIGESSFGFGKSISSVGEGTFSGGEGNIAGGDYGAVFGKDNKVGFGSLVGGVYNNFPGQWNIGGGSTNKSDLSTRAAIIGGNGNEIYGSGYGVYSGIGNLAEAALYAILSGNSNKLSGNYNILNGEENDIIASFILALGKGLKTETDGQVLLGKWNAPNPEAGVLYGNGTSDGNRKNAFEILKDGSAKFAKLTDLKGAPYLKEADLKDYLKGDTQFNIKFGAGITITGSYNEARGLTIAITGDYNEAAGKSLTITGEANVLKGQYLSCEGSFNYIEGKSCHTTGDFNFIRGDFLTASGNQTVLGKYNAEDPDKIFIIGGGTSLERRNILTVDRNGNVQYNGNQ